VINECTEFEKIVSVRVLSHCPNTVLIMVYEMQYLDEFLPSINGLHQFEFLGIVNNL
jgi:hypothetical protein